MVRPSRWRSSAVVRLISRLLPANRRLKNFTTRLHASNYTGCLRLVCKEWGISLDGCDIGAAAGLYEWQKRSGGTQKRHRLSLCRHSVAEFTSSYSMLKTMAGGHAYCSN